MRVLAVYDGVSGENAFYGKKTFLSVTDIKLFIRAAIGEPIGNSRIQRSFNGCRQ